MATKIQLRRDTAANWTSNNPTLSAGEAGVETDTLQFKIGDGATAWGALPYQGSTYGDSDVASLLSDFGANVISTNANIVTTGKFITNDQIIGGFANFGGSVQANEFFGSISGGFSGQFNGPVTAGGNVTGLAHIVRESGEFYANSSTDSYNWNTGPNNELFYDKQGGDPIASLDGIGTSAPRVTFSGVTGANANQVNFQVFYLKPGEFDDGFNFQLFLDDELTVPADGTLAFGLDNDSGELLYDFTTFDNNFTTRIGAGFSTQSYNGVDTQRTNGAVIEIFAVPVLPSHSNTALPTAVTGGMIFVTNGNNKPAYSDGSGWFYVHDNSAVT